MTLESDPEQNRRDDYFPIISPCRPDYPHFYEQLELSDKHAAVELAQFYGGMVIKNRLWYRQYFIIHTDPKQMRWLKQEMVTNIDDIMTPEDFIEQFGKDGKNNRFDFLEWSFPDKDMPVSDSADF